MSASAIRRIGARSVQTERQNAERCRASDKADDTGTDPSGSGAVGEALPQAPA
jgi:hypothetical protein